MNEAAVAKIGQQHQILPLCGIQLTRGSISLNGTSMTDGTYCFFVNGETRSFKTPQEVWTEWELGQPDA